VTLEELGQLAHDRKAVVVNYPGKPVRIPAAFVLQMQAAQVLKFMRWGMTEYRNKRQEVAP